MDGVQNCNSYINVLSSNPYRSYYRNTCPNELNVNLKYSKFHSFEFPRLVYYYNILIPLLQIQYVTESHYVLINNL
jgi:hypothetical protein